MGRARISRERSGSVVTQSVSELGAFAEPWDALVAESPLASPYLRSWFLSAAVPDVEPLIVLALEGDALLGGIALEQRSIGVMRLLRPLGFRIGADHVGVVARAGRHLDVTAALRSHLRRLGNVLVVLPSADCSPATLASMPGPVSAVIVDASPFADLSQGYDAWLARRGAKLRRENQRRRRHLEARGVHHVVVPPEELDGALVSLRELHAAIHGDRSQLLPVFGVFERTVRAGVAAGEAVVHGMRDGAGAFGAMTVVFTVAGRASLGPPGRSRAREWDGAGNVMIDHIARYVGARGCHEFDLLRGTEDYKLRLSDGARDLVTLRSRHGLVTHGIDALALGARDARQRALLAYRRRVAPARPDGAAASFVSSAA